MPFGTDWFQFTALLEPGASPPFDVFPFLKYIPASLNPWKRSAIEVGERLEKTWTQALDIVERRRSAGDVRSSIADSLLNKETQPERLDLVHTLGEILEGASHTTSSQILTALLALAKHPEVQRKAWLELDAVCGVER
jgi:cytochrome P450